MDIRTNQNLWIEKQLEIVSNALLQAFAELSLKPNEEQETRRELEGILERDLTMIVKSLTLIAALGVNRPKDERYFKKHGVPEHQAEDLAQTPAEKILKPLFSNFPRGNIGAWRSKLRHHVLIDYGRKAKTEKQHLEQQQNPEDFVDKCNPFLEQEALEEYFHRWSVLVSTVVRQRLNGDSWEEIAVRNRLTLEEVKEIAQRACSSGGKSSPRKKRFFKKRT